MPLVRAPLFDKYQFPEEFIAALDPNVDLLEHIDGYDYYIEGSLQEIIGLWEAHR